MGIGGIGVGLIMKYTSVINQSYAMIFGILLSGMLRSLLYLTPISNTMYIAMLMVMFSFYWNTPHQNQNDNENVQESLFLNRTIMPSKKISLDVADAVYYKCNVQTLQDNVLK